MEITKEFDVTPIQVFTAIRQSLQKDYLENTGEELGSEEIGQGLHYIKYFGKNKQNKVKVIISDWQENSCYSVDFISNRGTHRMRYDLEPIDAEHTKIIYSEELMQSGFFQKANLKFLELFLKKSFLVRMDAQLEALIKQAKASDLDLDTD